MESEKPSISTSSKVLIVGTGVLIDLVQFLISFVPVVGEIISIFLEVAWQFILYLWCKMNGISYMGSTKRMVSVFGSMVVGFIPVLDMLPECTFEILMILGTLEAEKMASAVPGGEAVVSTVSKTK